MSENENIDPKKPARTSKASATPHKPGCGCPRCVYRRRKAGEPPIPPAPPSARAGSRGRPADAQAGERILGLGDVQAPEWANVLEMIEAEFPEFMGETWWAWRVYLKVLAALPLDEREAPPRTRASAHGAPSMAGRARARAPRSRVTRNCTAWWKNCLSRRYGVGRRPPRECRGEVSREVSSECRRRECRRA